MARHIRLDDEREHHRIARLRMEAEQQAKERAAQAAIDRAQKPPSSLPPFLHQLHSLLAVAPHVASIENEHWQLATLNDHWEYVLISKSFEVQKHDTSRVRFEAINPEWWHDGPIVKYNWVTSIKSLRLPPPAFNLELLDALPIPMQKEVGAIVAFHRMPDRALAVSPNLVNAMIEENYHLRTPRSFGLRRYYGDHENRLRLDDDIGRKSRW